MDIGTVSAWQDALAIQIMRLARRAAHRMLNHDDADDVAQQVVLTCLEKLRSGQMAAPPAHLSRLVRRMVRHGAFDLERRRKSRRVREREHGQELFDWANGWMDPDRAFDAEELAAFHEETLRALPETCRRAFVLVREGHATYRLAGRELGLTPLAICAHVVTAHAAFRQGLARRGIAAPPARTLRRNRRGEGAP